MVFNEKKESTSYDRPGSGEVKVAFRGRGRSNWPVATLQPSYGSLRYVANRGKVGFY